MGYCSGTEGREGCEAMIGRERYAVYIYIYIYIYKLLLFSGKFRSFISFHVIPLHPYATKFLIKPSPMKSAVSSPPPTEDLLPFAPPSTPQPQSSPWVVAPTSQR